MTTDRAKVEIKIGNLSFSAEGDQQWLAEQVTKVIQAASAAITASGAADAQVQSPGNSDRPAPKYDGSLASYIKAKGGAAKQVRRFLAAAGWLHLRGQEKLTPTAVTKALADNHQSRLANAADCLNKNVSKGYCEKSKDGFFITPEGWKELGEQQ